MDVRNTCLLPDYKAANELTKTDFDAALSQIHPRTYYIQLPPELDKENIRVFVTGCAGAGDVCQQSVGLLMNQVAKKEGKPLFMIFCGDNIYDAGAKHPVKDEQFQKYFYQMYYDPTLDGINDVPSIVLLGNHDGNYNSPSKLARQTEHSSILGIPTLGYYAFGSPVVGWEIEKNEVLHGLLPTKNFTFTQQVDKFQQQVLRYDQLSAWNMPASSFSFVLGGRELFFVNTNCFFAELLDYFHKTAAGEEVDINKNQIAWLIQEYAIAREAGRDPILITHHPAMITLGKHLIAPDTEQYISKEQIAELNTLLGIDPPTKFFTELLSKSLDYFELKFNLKINAHDHLMNYIRDPKKGAQLTVGGGGGKLQSFFKLNYLYSGCQLEQFGFAALNIPMRLDPEKKEAIDIDIYTVDGLHLRFNTESHVPEREGGSLFFETLRDKVLKASRLYFDNLILTLDKSPNKTASQGFFGASMQKVRQGIAAVSQLADHVKSHKKTEPAIVLDIAGYFDQYQVAANEEAKAKALDYRDAKIFLEAKLDALRQFTDSKHSFINYLQQEAPELFPTPLEQFPEITVSAYTPIV